MKSWTGTSTGCTLISVFRTLSKKGRERMRLRHLLLAAAAALVAGTASAQGIDVKVGILNDRSGTYADLSGEGSVVAARMAVEDSGAAKKGINVEIVSAD